jgi:hypothetical protein
MNLLVMLMEQETANASNKKELAEYDAEMKKIQEALWKSKKAIYKLS